MAGAASHSETKLQPATAGGSWIVELSPALERDVENFARPFNGDRATVLLRALALYKLALKAKDDGKSIGIIGPDGEVEREIIGF